MIGLTHAVESVPYGLLLQSDSAPALTVLVGGALIFYGMSLVAWGGFGQGNVSGRSAGVVSAVAGLLGVIWAAFLVFPVDAASAAVVGAFGFAFLSAGIHTSFGVDLAGHGLLCLVLAGVTAIVAWSFTFPLSEMAPYLAVALWSYVAVLVGFFGGAYYGTDRWLQAFTGLSYLTGVLTTGLYGALLITGYVGF